MSVWYNGIDESLPEAKEAFSSLESVWSLKGESITTSSLCSVDRVELDGQGYYVKRYRRAGEGVAEFVGVSKARREWSNLARFDRWNLPVAALVAYGEDPWWKSPRRGVVVTAEVVGSVDLASLASQQSPLLDDNNWVNKVSQKVASASAVMHEHKFAHNDWKWRNILVSGEQSDPKIHLIDCPSGTFWWGPFFEYRRIKDIACLDKIAKKTLTSEQRREFYRLYRGGAQLDAKDERDMQKVVRFFKGRD
ncbi:MAG: lipopolysaccharide kinase InaA family protein [Cellvibrionaceae bacterium]